MAQRPLRPCRRPGCRRLTADGWCDEHWPEPRPGKPHQRGESAAWHRFYDLPAWQTLRGAQLIREPWCAECTRLGIRERATVVDHIRPHRGQLELFLDAGNLQSLCKLHHDQKTMRERRERGEFR